MKKPLKITLVIFLIVLGIGVILYYVFFLSPPLVHLSVSTDKNQYKVGEVIEITSRLYKNSLRILFLPRVCVVESDDCFHTVTYLHKKGEKEDLIRKFSEEKYNDEKIPTVKFEGMGECFCGGTFKRKFDVTETTKIKVPLDVEPGEYVIEDSYELETMKPLKVSGTSTIIIEK